MNEKKIKLLLIEDNVAQAQLVKKMLDSVENHEYEIEWVNTIRDGLKILADKRFDIILTDLQLHGGYGLETLRMVQDQAHDLPIVVVTSLEDENIANKAIQSGAQDYLMKSRLDSQRLDRAIRYGILRHELVNELRSRYEERIEELARK